MRWLKSWMVFYPPAKSLITNIYIYFFKYVHTCMNTHSHTKTDFFSLLFFFCGYFWCLVNVVNLLAGLVLEILLCLLFLSEYCVVSLHYYYCQVIWTFCNKYMQLPNRSQQSSEPCSKPVWCIYDSFAKSNYDNPLPTIFPRHIFGILFWCCIAIRACSY